MEHRYETGHTPNTEQLSGSYLVEYILEERRKELVFRGLKWGDVKRLNKVGADINLERYKEDNTAERLPSGSPKFNLPIPQGIINQTNMEQN
ncbi:hypothetical protein [Sphingobacterium hotanense]|uniref:hypothetical protein n=1 Tax=Sphingobacterium hotanense TaxID=649196 RepID=UPI0021A34275|nr:hypothetical protein [Sphingobacterium hotanense]MCT1526842.1 hypothetical protein [Sphingobacterium hotanense]